MISKQGNVCTRRFGTRPQARVPGTCRKGIPCLDLSPVSDFRCPILSKVQPKVHHRQPSPLRRTARSKEAKRRRTSSRTKHNKSASVTIQLNPEKSYSPGKSCTPYTQSHHTAHTWQPGTPPAQHHRHHHHRPHHPLQSTEPPCPSGMSQPCTSPHTPCTARPPPSSSPRPPPPPVPAQDTPSSPHEYSPKSPHHSPYTPRGTAPPPAPPPSHPHSHSAHSTSYNAARPPDFHSHAAR